MELSSPLRLNRASPSFTVALGCLAGLAAWSPAVSAALIYDRRLIAAGECWRLWTGHLVHFGFSHFLWNLAVVVPAGIWLEGVWPRATRWFYLASPLLISAGLYQFDPTLERYAGLSGLATGQLVMLAALQLGRRAVEPVWFWLSVLALVAIKLGVELFTGEPVFVSGFGSIRTVPLAHLQGVACGLIAWAAVKWQESRDRVPSAVGRVPSPGEVRRGQHGE